MLKDLVKKCRSYRRFFQEVSIPYEDLKDMVDISPSDRLYKELPGA